MIRVVAVCCLASLCWNTHAAQGQAEQDPQTSVTSGIDLDEAALKRDEFTREKAGPTAMSSFRAFLEYRDRGDEQTARDYFMLAQSQKAGYVASEIAKLQATYDNAVELYNQGTYGEAAEQFRMLIEIRPNQIGYEEFYRPNASSIRQYLTDSIYKNETERAARFETRWKDSRFTVWYTGTWMAQLGELGLEATRLATTGTNQVRVPLPDFKLAARSYLGGDLGLSVRITDLIWAGASWSQFMVTPHAEFTMNNLDHTPRISGASISALSFFVETSSMVTRTTRMYLQAGAGRYSANFPGVLLGSFERPPRLLSHKSTSIGGFIGGGCDVWFLATDVGLLGGRLDLKYHRMSGDDQDSERSITLNGLRVGAGLTFSL